MSNNKIGYFFRRCFAVYAFAKASYMALWDENALDCLRESDAVPVR